VLERGRPLVLDSLKEHVSALREYVDAGVQALAVLPIDVPDARGHGARLALVFARTGARRAWSPLDADLLEVASRSVEVATDRRRRQQRLEREARADALTGLGNRRALEADLEAEVKHASAYGGRFSLALMDLDGLKRINDADGHERGDALLRRFADALLASFRPADRVYRLGGDEFVVLLRDARDGAPPAAQRRARRAIEAVRAAGFGAAGVSVGVASFPTDGRDPATLLRVGDARMYERKGAGRRATDAAGPSVAADAGPPAEPPDDGPIPVD
jgi:diguanylate cyclase (GGDEF)-like protein